MSNNQIIHKQLRNGIELYKIKLKMLEMFKETEWMTLNELIMNMNMFFHY